jgi:hypothetical protein
VVGLQLGWTDFQAAIVLLGFGVAAFHDWNTREVDDRVWQVMAVIGTVVGVVLLAPEGVVSVGLWAAVSLLALEQLFPWDLSLERVDERLPGYVEIVAFLAVGVLLVADGAGYGLGGSGVPLVVVAAFASILLGRGLFEARLLYGGADAKALITTGVVLPVLATPWLGLSGNATRILSIYPFALTLLMNAAIVALAVPISLAVRNFRQGDFEFPRSFSGFTIPVSDLTTRFVWLKDPTFQGGEEAETAEEDLAIRRGQQAELSRQGVSRVWVTPQVPFLVLMFVGAVLGVALGNLIFDVLAYA